MKIALYVYSWPAGSSANGIVTYAAQLVPALRELGHEVFVLTTNLPAGPVDAYTIDLNAIPRPAVPLWSRFKSIFNRRSEMFGEQFVSAIATLTRRHHFDIVEIEESFGWGLQVAQAQIIPVVIRLHGPWFLNGNFDNVDEATYRERVKREGQAIESATLVTAPSANALENVRTYYNLNLDLARVIPNSFDVCSETDAWQLESCDPTRLLYVGRFDRRKGGDLVLRAFADLAELYPSLRLSFVGPDDGLYEDGHRQSFEEFVRRNLPASCRSQIDFFGNLPHERVMALRNEHFLTIIASQFETFSYAVIEAMSYGCPIVASSVGGIPELITDGKNGILFKSKDVNNMVAACRRLLENHALASSLGAQARQDCRDLFNAKRVAIQTISAYQAAIASFNGSSETVRRVR